VREHLNSSGYINGYVTIDTNDWFIAKIVDEHQNSGGQINRPLLCSTFTEMIWETMIFYDDAAKNHLKRSPKHMLLLHENDVVALCLDQLIEKILIEDWQIISPDMAIVDPIYLIQPDTLYNANGQIAAIIHADLGEKIKDPWIDTRKIKAEFERRKILMP
jgi:hypothetical protein